ncbi:RagB/SusD family nutrient uptake outer membrane protein [Sunxiuqinia sp. A32]|uniref:RagB/SusD family nutrient uptake outer membrane protein n=1 Tax=Sunxiuqinia sp. A32 TaxID=3461496 RepID=UPI0040456BFC
MKIYNKYIIVLLVSILFAGCDSFLDVNPIGNETQVNFFETPENAIYAVTACYDPIGLDEGEGFSHNYLGMIADMCTSDSDKGSTETDFTSLIEFFEWRKNPSDGVLRTFYGLPYNGIARCNEVLKRLSVSSLEEKLRTRLQGEVLFIRGYWYYKLVILFGGVPVFTEPVSPSDFGVKERNTYHETFMQVIDDLKSSIELLPEKSGYDASDLGRITKGAARALLARVYMYQIGMDAENSDTNWDDVYTQTNAVIQSGEYSLVSNYATIFEMDGENSSESIWELQMTEGTSETPPQKTGTNINQFCGNRKDWGWGFFNPTQELVESFDDDDPRLSCVIYGPSYNNGVVHGRIPDYDLTQQCSPYLSRKVALEPAQRPAISKSSGYNWRMIRYAEVLLTQAEALYHKGDESGARQYLEMVRARARNSTFCKGYVEGSLDYTPTGFTGNLPEVTASGAALLDAILKERRLEFAMESHRFFDLVRTGRYLDDLDVKKATSVTNSGAYRYANVDLRANCLSHSIDGPDGHKIPLLPIPYDEVQSWSLEQNPNY